MVLRGCCCPDWTEIRMGHCFLGGQSVLDTRSALSRGFAHGKLTKISYLVIVPQQLVQKIYGIVAYESLIFCIDETVPILLWKSPKYVIVLGIKVDIILIQVLEQVVRAKHFRNFDQLIRIAIAMEEGFFSKNHGGEHSS